MKDDDGQLIPATIARLKAHAHKLRYYDDERAIGNNIIMDLHPGWRFTTDPLLVMHVEGAETVAEAAQTLRGFTAPCDCPECLDEGA